MEYKMPTKSTLRSRSSTISNAFAISVTPFIKPSDVEISNSLIKGSLKTISEKGNANRLHNKYTKSCSMLFKLQFI